VLFVYILAIASPAGIPMFRIIVYLYWHSATQPPGEKVLSQLLLHICCKVHSLCNPRWPLHCNIT